jgi:hypothetical protein
MTTRAQAIWGIIFNAAAERPEAAAALQQQLSASRLEREAVDQSAIPGSTARSPFAGDVQDARPVAVMAAGQGGER